MNLSQKTIGVVGLGLIGGSLGAAIKKYIPKTTVIGFDNNNTEANKAASYSLVDDVEITFEKLVNSADILVLATPLLSALKYIRLLHSYNRQMIVSDVCSVKRPLLQAAETLSGNMTFVGGHPMAGSQKSGNDYADPDMFQGAAYVLCPPLTGKIPTELTDIITAIGGQPVLTSPEEHDKAVSRVSHAPQLLAVSLLNELQKGEDSEELLLKLAAGGFKDVTRIGESSYTVWKDILAKNKDNIISDISRLIIRLNDYKDALQTGKSETLEKEFDKARSVREKILRDKEL